MRYSIKVLIVLAFGISSVIVFNSCNDDFEELATEIPEETSTENPTSLEPLVDLSLYSPTQSIVSTSVTGIVRDENAQPLEGARVILGDEEYLTSATGRFIALEVPLNAKGTSYTVHMEGYFKGVRRIYPQENSLHQTSIQLIPREVVGSFNSEVGATVSTKENLSISFSPNSIIDNEGNLVDGEVEVSAFWIDPSKEEVNQTLPGSLVGLNSDIEEVALVSYSMAAIELTANGQEVNIAPGETAAIEFPIPEDLLANAPAEIALWSLDEELGIWIEEGVALKEGNKYVGVVSHFSFWNCDAPFPLVDVCGMVVYENGEPASGVQITAILEGPNFSGHGYSDSNGVFGGLVASDVGITLEISQAGCALAIVNIGPFSENTKLDPITLLLPDQIVVSGNVVGCEGLAIPNAIVELSNSIWSDIQQVDSNGHFEFPSCQSEVSYQVQAFDYDNLTQSQVVSATFSDDFSFGDIEICNEELETYLSITHQDSTKVIGDFWISIPDVTTDGVYAGDYILDLLFIDDLENGIYVFNTSFGIYNEPSNSWNISVDDLVSDFNIGYEIELDYSTPEPDYAYGCGFSCASGYATECEESCANFQFTLIEFNVNPVFVPNWGWLDFSPGDVIHAKITGTTPQGEFLEFEFRKAY